MRPLCMDRDWADSNRTFCHSRVREACSAGIGPRWRETSMGAPAAMSLCRKPGARDLGHFPRCSDRVRCSPTLTSLRLTSASTCSVYLQSPSASLPG